MTATSILKNTMNRYPVFMFTKEPVQINNAYQRFSQGYKVPVNNLNINQEDTNTMSFVSDEIKVFLTVYNGMYHFWHDTIGPFLYQLEKTPDALFVFDTVNLYEQDDKFIDFLSKILIDKKINHRFIKTSEDLNIVANNFYSQTGIDDESNAGNRVYDFVNESIKNKTVKPFRKVYASRAIHGKRYYEDQMVDGPSFKNDNRIDDEKKLEDLFISLGFEVIIPERDFKTFQDQVNYFYEVETLVHLTGGGGTNSMFMQPGGNIIEIITSMVVQTTDSEEFQGKKNIEEALHHFYTALSFNKDHNYVGIANPTRSVDVLIEKIKTNKLLKSVFEGIS